MSVYVCVGVVSRVQPLLIKCGGGAEALNEKRD